MLSMPPVRERLSFRSEGTESGTSDASACAGAGAVSVCPFGAGTLWVRRNIPPRIADEMDDNMPAPSFFKAASSTTIMSEALGR